VEFARGTRRGSRQRRVNKGSAMAKPTVVVVGADKGGGGKTTVARTLLDYFAAHHVPTRAFDTESPKGTLKRFHPNISKIVDATSVSDQMRIFDTLSTTDASVTVIDVRAGLLSPTLRSLRDIGFLDAVKKGQLTFVVFHILGSSIASLNEIEDTSSFAVDGKYFLVKNFINNTSFFEWDQATHASYFRKFKDAVEITIPKLNEMAMSRSSWPRFRSSPSSPTKARSRNRPTIRSCFAAMSATGWATCGPNTTASSSTRSFPAAALRPAVRAFRSSAAHNTARL
jgi:hypothetical protein